MRNLKKVLALVLALVMSLSLVTIANASDFTDSDEITYDEAVDVMTAIGVLDGLETGAFNPTGTLTREQAAKILCTMLLGDNADKLGTTSSSFSDVAATRWSSPYIEYCVQTGIVAGVGDGKFNPTGNLTGYAFAKMLLVALGYDAAIQSYTGTGWNVNVAKDAVTAGIDVDGVLMSNYLTREQAAQMAFQTLTADMVKYDNKGTSINMPDGTSVVMGASDPEKIANSASNDYHSAVASRDTIQQFCEQYFSKLKLSASGTDAMGRPASSWTYKSTTVGTYADAPDYTAYVTATDNTLTKVIDSISKKFDESGATVVVNGVAGVVAIGDYVEIYMDADDAEAIDVIAVTHKSVAKLTGDAATKADDDDTLVKVPGITGLNTFVSANTTETVKGYAGLVEDDIVLWYKDSEGTYYMEKAESFTGTLTAVSGTKYTIDGTKYNQSGATGSMAGITVSSFYSDAATWYTDNDGNVVWVEGVESTELAYVVDSADPADDWGTTTHKAKLMTMDGTIITVETEDSASTLEGQFVKYSVDSDDVYTLDAADSYVSGTEGQVASSDISEAVITKGNPTVKLDDSASVLANSSTVFMVRDYKADGTAKESYTLYTGYTKVPTMSSLSGGTASMDAYVGSNGYAKYVVIDPNGNVTGSTSADDLFYVVDNTVTTLYDADGIRGYSVQAIKNGDNEIIDLEFSYSPSVLTDKAYIAETYNDDGQVTSISAAITQADEYLVGSKTGKANDGTFMLGGSGYAYTDSTVVYYVNADDELTVTTVADLEDDVNDTYVAVRASDSSSDSDYNTITVVFVREVEGTTQSDVAQNTVNDVIASATEEDAWVNDYTPAGDFSVSGTTVTVAYDSTNVAAGLAGDLPRFLGTIYADGNGVKSIVYGGKTYTWITEDVDVLEGSNWRTGSADSYTTLVSAISAAVKDELDISGWEELDGTKDITVEIELTLDGVDYTYTVNYTAPVVAE